MNWWSGAGWGFSSSATICASSSEFCDRVLVLEAGRIVESCEAASLAAARHPYTRRLMAARPSLIEAP